MGKDRGEGGGGMSWLDRIFIAIMFMILAFGIERDNHRIEKKIEQIKVQCEEVGE